MRGKKGRVSKYLNFIFISNLGYVAKKYFFVSQPVSVNLIIIILCIIVHV